MCIRDRIQQVKHKEEERAILGNPDSFVDSTKINDKMEGKEANPSELNDQFGKDKIEVKEHQENVADQKQDEEMVNPKVIEEQEGGWGFDDEDLNIEAIPERTEKVVEQKPSQTIPVESAQEVSKSEKREPEGLIKEEEAERGWGFEESEGWDIPKIDEKVTSIPAVNEPATRESGVTAVTKSSISKSMESLNQVDTPKLFGNPQSNLMTPKTDKAQKGDLGEFSLGSKPASVGVGKPAKGFVINTALLSTSVTKKPNEKAVLLPASKQQPKEGELDLGNLLGNSISFKGL
eukprot:TRINITY_DN12530_c0_g1_i3.p1 TRINITY_DN12530_c0_g1~~TRINITY_DN12530_c0_g1_i3.p1  ORF type:complete len:322 (-),score=89.22 TRINITY_DN12530_c0_g1_i3:80-952(-)